MHKIDVVLQYLKKSLEQQFYWEQSQIGLLVQLICSQMYGLNMDLYTREAQK